MKSLTVSDVKANHTFNGNRRRAQKVVLCLYSGDCVMNTDNIPMFIY